MLKFFSPSVLNTFWLVFLSSLLATSTIENPFTLFKDNPFEIIVSLMYLYGYSLVIAIASGVAVVIVGRFFLLASRSFRIKTDRQKFLYLLGNEHLLLSYIIKAWMLLVILFFAITFNTEYDYTSIGRIGIILMIILEFINRLGAYSSTINNRSLSLEQKGRFFQIRFREEKETLYVEMPAYILEQYINRYNLKEVKLEKNQKRVYSYYKDSALI